MKKITFMVLTVLMLFAISIQAQTIPSTINYQGVLKDGSGVVVANGNYNITFKFYDVETSGTELWTETNVVSVVDGMINTQIGSATPLTLPFDGHYWLGITIEAGSELSPRIKLTSAPYSLMSQSVMNESITTSKLFNGSVTTNKISDNAITTIKISDGTITANDIADNQLIKKVNGIKDSVNLVAGSNVSITPSGNTLTISSSGGTGGGDITAVYAGTGLTGGGTTGDVTLSVANDGITNTMLQNNSVNSSKINDGTINAVDIGSSQIVKSVNTLKDNVGIIGGSNINIGASGNDIIISSTGGGLTLPFNGTLNTSNTAALNISHTSTTGTNYGLYTTINSISGAAVYGLGTTMGVSGIANATDGLTRGIFGESHSTAGYGVWGSATATTGTNYGVYGRSYSNGGYGLYGFASASSGTTYGIYGRSSSNAGYGIYGLNTATLGNTYGIFGTSSSSAGTGVYGENTSTTGTTYGIYAKNNSTTGIGLYALNTATTGANYSIFAANNSTTGRGIGARCYSTTGVTYGILGANNSTSGYGVYGTADATTGVNYGVYGRSFSTTGVGVYGTSPQVGVHGIATATTGENYGVWGKTNSPDGAGVWGDGPLAGVIGINTTNNAGLGIGSVTGLTLNGSGYAGYFNAGVWATNGYYGGKFSIKIDHPLDPGNKYLNHSSVESSDMKNIYDGNITTDAAGYATVTLPDWFEALNKNFRYQLTVIGTFAQAIISREIQGNKFEIKTNEPNVKVSWQVTGIRHDAFTEKNRMIVEELKKGNEVGIYLHPEAFGKSREQGIGYSLLQKLRPEIIQKNEDLLLPEQNLNVLSPESIISEDINRLPEIELPVHNPPDIQKQN